MHECTELTTAKEPRYQVTYLASGSDCRQQQVLSVSSVEQYTKQPVSSANFRHFPITSSSREKDTRISLLFHTASDGELGRTWS